MTRNPDPIVQIVASDDFQDKIAGPMIDEFVRRLSRPGPDGRTSRRFLEDWLYFERPMFDRFVGERFSAQFEGPALAIGGDHYPLGGFILRHVEWARIDPVDASELRIRLRRAVDQVVAEWIDARPMKFLPANPEKPFPDRAAVDAEAAQKIRDFLGPTGSAEGER